ncbi:MAG: ParB/RepB/Spo0J family partition protein [Candidatus Omnitrophota bacterium]
MNNKALGKGLSALIPKRIEPENNTDKPMKRIIDIDIQQVHPSSYQPRQEFDAEKLQDLANSIREKGVIQPIVVRRNQQGRYELIAGERRWRAANLLKLNKIPAIIKDVDDEESMQLSLIENIQREDLNPVEQAQAYKKLIDKFGFTQERIAQTMGKARVTITNILRILKLPDEIREALKNNRLSFGHARALLEIENCQEQLAMAEKIIASEISVRELENLLKHRRSGQGPRHIKRSAEAYGLEPFIRNIEEHLQRVLGTKVRIHRARKRGRIEIEFYSHEDLERIVEVIQRQ